MECILSRYSYMLCYTTIIHYRRNLSSTDIHDRITAVFDTAMLVY